MLHTLLKSGLIRDYKAIGQDGIPVYQRAISFRDALERAPEVGAQYAQYLAVPQFNADKTQVDWYTPNPPKSEDGEYQIVKWTAASTEERTVALKKLDDLTQVLRTYGKRLINRGEKGDNLVLAHFLTGTEQQQSLPAIHFPNLDCIFIVDNEPVITFWGFLDNNSELNYDPLLKLRSKSDSSSFNSGSSFAQKNLNSSLNQQATINSNGKKHHCALLHSLWGGKLCGFFHRFWPWVLGLIALCILLPLLWWLLARLFGWPNFSFPSFGVDSADSYIEKQAFEEPNNLLPDDNHELVVEDPDISIVDKGNKDEIVAASEDNLIEPKVEEVVPEEEDPVVTNEQNVSEDNNQKPVQEQASQLKSEEGNTPITPQEEVIPQNSQEQQNIVSQPVATADPIVTSNQPLVLNQQALAHGDLSALRGQWNTRSGLMDKQSGRPLNMSYDFNGKDSSLTIKRQDGVACSVKTNTITANGVVQITSNGKAVCKDNVSYDMPVIKCEANAQGKTSCYGQYQNGEKFPIRMFKQ